jgi:hypothetical protein
MFSNICLKQKVGDVRIHCVHIPVGHMLGLLLSHCIGISSNLPNLSQILMYICYSTILVFDLRHMDALYVLSATGWRGKPYCQTTVSARESARVKWDEGNRQECKTSTEQRVKRSMLYLDFNAQLPTETLSL